MMIDANNLPAAPDSNLDSDLSTTQSYEIQPDVDGKMTQDISLGDWIDVDPAIGMEDPNWGFSFQVVGLNANSVTVLYSSDAGVSYSTTEVSAAGITNVFPRKPRS